MEKCEELPSTQQPPPSPAVHNNPIEDEAITKADIPPEHLKMLIQAVNDFVEVLPPYPMRQMKPKRHMKEVSAILKMSADDPNRETVVRRFSPLYGPSDIKCTLKRRRTQPVTGYRLVIDEAAAHFCLRMPSLLTRREDLMSLTRSVIKMLELSNPNTRIPKAFKGMMIASNDPQEMLDRWLALRGDICEVVAQVDNTRSVLSVYKDSEYVEEHLCEELQHDLDKLSSNQNSTLLEITVLLAQMRRKGVPLPVRSGAS